jgi:hypothetical protein
MRILRQRNGVGELEREKRGERGKGAEGCSMNGKRLISEGRTMDRW